MIHLQATGQHKNKVGLTHFPVLTHLHQHTWKIKLLHVQNVHTKYRKYFRGVLNSRLLNFARNSRKLLHREYYHFYRIAECGMSGSNGQAHIENLNSRLGPALDPKPCLLARRTCSIRIQQNGAWK